LIFPNYNITKRIELWKRRIYTRRFRSTMARVCRALMTSKLMRAVSEELTTQRRRRKFLGRYTRILSRSSMAAGAPFLKGLRALRFSTSDAAVVEIATSPQRWLVRLAKLSGLI
jgi:hypothetical protein